MPFVPGEQAAAFGSQGKKWDSVWEAEDWRRPAAAPAAPAAAAPEPAAAAAVAVPEPVAEPANPENAELLFLRNQVRVLQDRLRTAEVTAREARRRELNLLIFYKRAQVAHVRFVPYLFNVAQYELELHALEEELAML